MTLDCPDHFKDVALVIAEMLRDVGIQVRVQVWEWSLLLPRIRAGERDMWISDWGNATLDPMDIMIPKLKTGERGNYTGYSNPVYDELVEFAELRAPDPEARLRAYHQAQELVHREAPMVFLWVAQESYGVSRRVVGWVPSPDSRINLHRADLTD